MIARRTAPLAAFVFTLAGVPYVARADGGSQAVAIVAGTRGALAARLSEELRVAGLSVRVEATISEARSDGIVLVIGEGDDPSVEIWARRADQTERVAVVAPGDAIDARVLRVAEIVRALALPRGNPSPPASEAPPLAPEPPARPAPSERSPAQVPRPHAKTAGAAAHPPPPPLEEAGAPALFEAGVFAGLGVAAQGPSMSVDATVRLWPHERAGVGLLASLPVVGARIGAAEGEATMRSFLFGAELEVAPIVRSEPFGVVLSPGIGFAHVTFSAEAAEGYRARDDGVFAGLAYGRVEGRLRVTDSVRVAAAALGGGVFPPIEVHFAGRPVSTFAFTGGVSLGVLFEL
jgi:hypothetical protein